MECKAKIMLKVAEKEVVGELKDHDHGPTIEVFEKGACKLIGKNMNKGDFTNIRTKNKNISKTAEAAQSNDVGQTKMLLTVKNKTVGVQTVDIQRTSVLTVGVQTIEIVTENVQSVETQTLGVQTTDSEIQTDRDREVQSTEDLDMGFNLFTEIPPIYHLSPPVENTLKNIPIEKVSPLEAPIPTVLGRLNNSLQNKQPTIFFESPSGIQISELPHTVEHLKSTENSRIGEISQPMEVNRSEKYQINQSTTPKTRKGRCLRHQHLDVKACRIKVCKNSSCRKCHKSKNVITPPGTFMKVKSSPVTDLRSIVNPKSIAQPMAVARPKTVAQFQTDTCPKSSAQTLVVTHPKTDSHPNTMAQPINIAKTTSFVNLVCLQTEKGPKIIALPQPSLTPITTKPSPSATANVSQSLYSMIAQGNMLGNSPLMIDLTSSLASQPSVINQTNSPNIPTYHSVSDTPSTGVVQPDISNIDQPVLMTPQHPSLMEDQPSIYKDAQDSTSNINRTSPKKVKLSPSLLTQLSSTMVSQFFTSLEQPSTSKTKIEHPATSEIPSSVVVDQPTTSELEPSSTLQIGQSTTSEINQSSTMQIDQSSTDVAEINQPSITNVDQPSTSEVEPSIVEVDKPFTSEVIQPLIVEDNRLLETSEVIKPGGVEANDSSSEVYLPPKVKATNITNTKKVKVAKRISKPRKSKYRAELLLKTYISDYSDDD